MAQVLEENFAIHNLIWTFKKVNECILEVTGEKRQTRGVSLTYEYLQKRKFSPMLTGNLGRKPTTFEDLGNGLN